MRKSLSSILPLALGATILFLSISIPVVQPWYAEGHTIVAWRAIRLLPAGWRDFFTYYGYVINATANYPDQSWQDFDPNEGPKHYIDLEIAGPNLENEEAGVLPYAINETYHMMVEFLRSGRIGMAMIYAGALCHYVGDAGQPYHTTVNYNPKGKHGLADSLLETHLGELTLIESYDLVRVTDVFGEAVRLIRESHSCLPVLNATLIGDPDDPNDDREWSDELRDMVEERANRVILFTANLWISATMDAGVTVPEVPPDNALRLTVSAPREVFDNRSARVFITVEDSLGVPVLAYVSVKFGGDDVLVVASPDKNPMGKHEALIPLATLVANSGKTVEVSVSASFLDRTPASWRGSIVVKASKPESALDQMLPVGAVALAAIVAAVIVFIVRRRKR